MKRRFFNLVIFIIFILDIFQASASVIPFPKDLSNFLESNATDNNASKSENKISDKNVYFVFYPLADSNLTLKQRLFSNNNIWNWIPYKKRQKDEFVQNVTCSIENEDVISLDEFPDDLFTRKIIIYLK